jgi:ATP-dependent Zn protease
VAGLEKKSRIITPGEKKAIAYHEAGHAAVSWLTEHASPLVKVTIVPRGRSLGAAWYLPEERQLTTKVQMIDEMCAALGGRASEEIVFGEVSTGALSDLEKVTKQAYAMVSVYGLNDKIGNISFYDSSGQSEYSFQKPYSEKTAETIDSEVKLMIDDAYKRTIGILNANRDKLNALAELLLEKEVIFKEDMETIFGKRTFNKELEEEESARKLKAQEELNGTSEVKESEEPKIDDESTVVDAPADPEATNPETINPDKNESSS